MKDERVRVQGRRPGFLYGILITEETCFMRFDGNKYFKIGLLILLVGLELRYVETFVLNASASRFVREKIDSRPAKAAVFIQRFFPTTSTFQQQTFTPPKWLGLAFISVGAVLILHSFVAKKQE